MISYEHQAQYYETDQMGIIHHSNYIRWMESARIWWMQQVGVDYKRMEEDGVVSPVLEVSCQYKSMVHFGDTVLITPKIENYNGIKLELSYEITDKVSGEIRTIGSSKHCFLDRDGRPVSLKKSYSMYDEAFRKGMMREA
ncbi:MAG: acyl-CoA thioesterase [Lachnospiraceae bacterium]|jgi:acyl-CoA thioester hydrolase|nr:acyl-CoA thioesterase [Lachnospiraceae bacterium]